MVPLKQLNGGNNPNRKPWRRSTSARVKRHENGPNRCSEEKEALERWSPRQLGSLRSLLTCEPESNQMKNKVTLFTVAQQAGP